MAASGFELHADAERELDDAVAIVSAARAGIGMEFVASVHAAIQAVVDYPLIGRKTRKRMRTFVMAGWPYTIVYSLEDDIVFVWAIAHHSRKPGYWRKRTR